MMSQAKFNENVRSNRAPPAMDLERPSLTQPWRSFLSSGLILGVTIEMTPTGTNTICTVDAARLGLKETKVAAGIARQAIIEKGLWTPGKPGEKKSVSKQELPKKSICKKDFEGNDSSILNRARSIANTIGDTTARGRVGSMGLARKGKDTFESWWNGAGGKRKLRLLSDKKHYESFSDEDFARFDKILVECPFRGAVPPLEEEEAEAPKAKAKGKQKKDE